MELKSCLFPGVVDNFKQASNNKDAGTDEQATQRNSSHVASCSGRQDQDPPKFDLSSDSDAVPSTPSDTEDSGVASGSRLGSFYRSGLRGREGIHRRWTGRDSSGSRSASFRGDGGRDTGTPQSRSPRHSSHNWRSPSRLSADHSSVSSISRPRGPVRTRGGKSCALPPAARKGMHSEEPWRNTSDHSNSVTPLNTHRTVPNRTTRERKLSDHEWDVDGVSSDHADESLDLSAVGSATPPMISVSVDNKDRLKLTVTTPVPPPSLRNLLTKPLAFTAASTPVRNSRASPLAKDTKFLSGQSPSRPSVTTTTAARGSVAPSVNQPVDVRRSPTISNTTAGLLFFVNPSQFVIRRNKVTCSKMNLLSSCSKNIFASFVFPTWCKCGNNDHCFISLAGSCFWPRDAAGRGVLLESCTCRRYCGGTRLTTTTPTPTTLTQCC